MTLKEEAILSSETSDNFYWTTWHHIPEDSTLPVHLISTTCHIFWEKL
jgi:hypothetical protein